MWSGSHRFMLVVVIQELSPVIRELFHEVVCCTANNISRWRMNGPAFSHEDRRRDLHG